MARGDYINDGTLPEEVPPGVAAWGENAPAFADPPIAGVPRDGIPLYTAVFNIFPGFLYPPGSAIRFGERAALVVAAANATTPIPFDRPIVWGEGALAALTYWEIQANNPTPAMDLFFTILFKGAPIPGLDRLKLAALSANAVLDGDNPYLLAGQSGNFTMTVTNNTGTAFTVASELSGWTFDAQDITEAAARATYLPTQR